VFSPSSFKMMMCGFRKTFFFVVVVWKYYLMAEINRRLSMKKFVSNCTFGQKDKKIQKNFLSSLFFCSL
jgi:hypothetical protein